MTTRSASSTRTTRASSATLPSRCARRRPRPSPRARHPRPLAAGRGTPAGSDENHHHPADRRAEEQPKRIIDLNRPEGLPAPPAPPPARRPPPAASDGRGARTRTAQAFESVMDDFLAGGGARGHQFALRRYEGGEGEGEDGGEDGGRAENAGPVIAPPPSNAVTRVVRYGDGGATLERDDDDDALQQHPFFDGLREAPKEAEWDVETILSTYTTTDNHPSLVARARPRQADPASPEDGAAARRATPRRRRARAERLTAARLRRARRRGGTRRRRRRRRGGSDDDDDGWSQAPVNAGAARGRGETAAEKRERKAAAKAQRQDRRAREEGDEARLRRREAAPARERPQDAGAARGDLAQRAGVVDMITTNGGVDLEFVEPPCGRYAPPMRRCVWSGDRVWRR